MGRKERERLEHERSRATLEGLLLTKPEIMEAGNKISGANSRGGSRIFERGGGGLIIKKLYSKSVHGALIKYHFGSSRNDASLCAHKLIQV